MTFSRKLEHVDRDHIDGLLEDLTAMGQHKRGLGADGFLCILIVVVVTLTCIYVKTHEVIH